MKLAICGVGAMGEALLSGWLAGGMTAGDVGFVEPSDARATYIASRYGVQRIELADAAAAEVIVLAVKPNVVADALRDISPTLDSLVISIAAGVPLDVLEWAAPGVPCVRVMPNTPALVGQGMSGIVAGNHATATHLELAVELMNAVGKTLVLTEDKLDALTAVSGSGPAYLFYLAEAMIESGVHLGLTRADAKLLVDQTLLGSATLLDSSEKSATELREMVTSPAGTTAAALAVLDDRAVRAAVLNALAAAAERGRQMATADKQR